MLNNICIIIFSFVCAKMKMKNKQSNLNLKFDLHNILKNEYIY